MLRYSASENCNGDLRARDGQIELTVLFAVLCNARRRGLGVRREGLFMKRRLFAFICALAISLCGLGGFAAAYAAEDTGAGMKFTVMLSQDHMYDSVGRTLEEKFPGAEFEFITTRTGADTILMQAHSDDLPDIIVGMPSGTRYDTDDLNQYLYDFNGTDIPGLFYKAYLDNYKSKDGSIRWLPGCAALEGVMANLDLFEQYGVDVPADYASFAAACEKFAQYGIRGFGTDWKYDYSDTYALQGWNIAALQTVDGLKWRSAMVTGGDMRLNDELGLKMFTHMQEVLRDTGVNIDDMKRGYTINYNELMEGKVAMTRWDSSLHSVKGEGMLNNVVLLPYFGENENESWYFSSPAYCVALNGKLSGDAREEAALEIVRTLFTQDVIERIAANNGGAITYVKGAHLELADEVKNIQPYVDTNHIYMIIDSGNIYSASQLAIHSMVEDGTSPEDALAMFNRELTRVMDVQPVIAHIDNSYSWQPAEHGSPAYSAIANTLRSINGVDMLLVTADAFATSVYAGDYTEAQLSDLLMSGGTYCHECKQATGKYIRELTRQLVEGVGATDDPVSFSTLPVSSGFEMQISQDADGRFHLDGLTVNGAPLEDDKTYYFGHIDLHATANLSRAYKALDGDLERQLEYAEDEWTDELDKAFDVYKCNKDKIVDQWLSYFKDGGTLKAPSDYMSR